MPNKLPIGTICYAEVNTIRILCSVYKYRHGGYVVQVLDVSLRGELGWSEGGADGLWYVNYIPTLDIVEHSKCGNKPCKALV